jgi:hypothetical protein
MTSAQAPYAALALRSPRLAGRLSNAAFQDCGISSAMAT